MFVLESATAPLKLEKTKSKRSTSAGDDDITDGGVGSTKKKKKKKTPKFKLNQEVLVMIKKLGRTVPGVVKFVGRTNFHKKTMVGVELAEAAGKTNGTVENVPYVCVLYRSPIFQCVLVVPAIADRVIRPFVCVCPCLLACCVWGGCRPQLFLLPQALWAVPSNHIEVNIPPAEEI